MRTSLGKMLKVAGCAIFMAAALVTPAKAANWQLVWSDEFNGSIGPDWAFENGGGGWGNNEQEYYQRQNATIENGMLVITAKRESVGGYNYTSTRMKTQGHKSWCHGKIVARMALPSFQGSWPAFWMLGDNIGSVGWPACGELDIMEQINTNNTVWGSTHWYSGGQADFTNSGNTNVTGFHEYSIEWDSQYIKWFIDGNQYNSFYIGGNAGGTGAFNQNNFFIILNLAVGGNWPGFSINNNAFPAKMYVDYVRVYQDSPNTAATSLVSGGIYEFVSAVSGKALDLDGWSTADGAKIQQWSRHGGACQQWRVVDMGNGLKLQSVSSGKVLDIPGADAHSGQKVQQWSDNGSNAQRFGAAHLGNGVWKFWPVLNGGLCLDVSGSSTADGAQVQVWNDNGTNAQRWILYRR